MKYAVVIRKLSDEMGGGYQGLVPDLYGCMSDGETPEEALINTQQAIVDWLKVNGELGRPAPEVGAAQKKAAEREKALLQTIAVLGEQFDSLDERLEYVLREIEHLQELYENNAAWERFDVLTSVKDSPEARPC